MKNRVRPGNVTGFPSDVMNENVSFAQWGIATLLNWGTAKERKIGIRPMRGAVINTRCS